MKKEPGLNLMTLPLAGGVNTIHYISLQYVIRKSSFILQLAPLARKMTMRVLALNFSKVFMFCVSPVIYFSSAGTSRAGLRSKKP